MGGVRERGRECNNPLPNRSQGVEVQTLTQSQRIPGAKEKLNREKQVQEQQRDPRKGGQREREREREASVKIVTPRVCASKKYTSV